jgi:hypothetical protein
LADSPEFYRFMPVEYPANDHQYEKMNPDFGPKRDNDSLPNVEKRENHRDRENVRFGFQHAVNDIGDDRQRDYDVEKTVGDNTKSKIEPARELIGDYAQGTQAKQHLKTDQTPTRDSVHSPKSCFIA